MIPDISGKWKFTEEFECGVDSGYAYLAQNENYITGYLEYEEKIEDEDPFFVRQDISGDITGHQISFQGVKVTDINGNILPDYNLDTLDGTITHEGKIVGHSFDSEDICGVFVFERS